MEDNPPKKDTSPTSLRSNQKKISRSDMFFLLNDEFHHCDIGKKSFLVSRLPQRNASLNHFLITVVSPRSARPKIPSRSLGPAQVGSPKMHEIADRVRKAASATPKDSQFLLHLKMALNWKENGKSPIP